MCVCRDASSHGPSRWRGPLPGSQPHAPLWSGPWSRGSTQTTLPRVPSPATHGRRGSGTRRQVLHVHVNTHTHYICHYLTTASCKYCSSHACDVVAVLSSSPVCLPQSTSPSRFSSWWPHGGASHATICASFWNVGGSCDGPWAWGNASHDG